jgi:hypothetical protein
LSLAIAVGLVARRSSLAVFGFGKTRKPKKGKKGETFF